MKCFEGVENGLEGATVQILIYAIIKGFKVYIGPIKISGKFEERPFVYVTIGNQNVFKACFSSDHLSPIAGLLELTNCPVKTIAFFRFFCT